MTKYEKKKARLQEDSQRACSLCAHWRPGATIEALGYELPLGDCPALGECSCEDTDWWLVDGEITIEECEEFRRR